MPDKLTLQYDVVMITKDRPDDIKKALASIADQTVLPAKIIIVDASTDDQPKKNIAEFQKKHPALKIVYRASPIASTTYQRNRAIELATSEITYFIDDDVVIPPNYAATTQKIYLDDPTVDAITGVEINHRSAVFSPQYKLFSIVFNLDTYGTKKPNRMKPSGFRWISVNPGKISRSDFMDTCCSSIKRKILDDFSFDENLGSYAVMEDLDFSIPVGRRHKIISHPDLRYFHNHSKSGRISRREDQKKFVFNHYYVYRKHMRKNLLTLFLHGWSHVGIVIDVVLYSIKSRSTDLLLGTIDAHGNIFKHMATGKFPDPSIKKPNS